MTRQVDAIADSYVTECAERYPELATRLGVPGHDHQWRDYSPGGLTAELDHLRSTLAALRAAVPCDPRERVAQEAMLERLDLQVELHAAHVIGSRVSVVAGATQGLINTLNLMPTDSAEAWHRLATRLGTVDAPLAQIQQTLAAEAEHGHVSAVRQIEATIAQIAAWTGQTGHDDYFAGLLARIPAALIGAVGETVARAADQARAAFAEHAAWFAAELAPLAPAQDAVGRERYALHSRYFLGAAVDLEEAYAWGIAELHRIQGEQRELARRLVGGPDIAAAYAALDAEPHRRLSPEAFLSWMQGVADAAIDTLGGREFDIPEPIRRIECCLAPTHEGGVYYTPPTEDFSRPGRMWWSVPEGVDSLSTWKETTTVYHEGVPGHHLQIGSNAVRADLLNRWQRKLCFVSGHGEGWALYAERLMDELGHLADPGDRMGMLDAQAFRAARVVVDIGMHLQLAIPADNPWGFHPGARWTPELGYAFLRANTAMDDPSLHFELDRYLGWPGQAPAYKLGERIWLRARADARARQGASFDLRRFHADALNLGPLGLDPLQAALARIG